MNDINTQISRVETNERVVALTIDGGPDEYTPLILSLLSEAAVKATLFMCGNSLEKFPELARQAAAAGHEIGNHSFSHARMPEQTLEQIREEIVRTQQLIEAATGHAARLFRAPFLACDDKVWTVLNELGLPAIHCSVDSQDYLEDISNEAVRDRMVSGVQPGGIILMHCWSKKSQAVVVDAVKTLRAAGYRLVTISELLVLGKIKE